MDFRQGTCTACKNSFRVPATFTAEKAKCPKCGGVVEIGPVQAAGSASTPSAKVASPTVAASATPVPAKAPAPKLTAPKPPVVKAEPRPAPKIVAPVTKESVRAATVAAKERVRAKGPNSIDGTETSRGGRPRREVPKKKKSPAPLLVGGLVLVAVIAVVLMKVFDGSGEKVAAPRVEAPVAKPDLSHIPDAEPLESTNPLEWQAMGELMTQYMTPPFDKNAERAGDLLVSRGKKSIPAVLNGFKRLDFSTSKGAEFGWKIQAMLLQGQGEGTNFGWNRDTLAANVAFNTRVIERWFKAWEEAQDDKDKWIAISQRAAAEAASAKPATK